MSKQAIEGAGRGAMLTCDPWSLHVVGRDPDPRTGVPAGRGHPLWDERALLDPDPVLVESMIAVGFFGAIEFRNNGDLHEVVFGRRRVVALREANRQLRVAGKPEIQIKAIHHRAEDATVMEIAIAENELRRDDDPLTRARKAQRMLDAGMSLSDIARAFGRGPEVLRENLKLLDLAPEIVAQIEAGELSPHAAVPLAGLRRDEQRPALDLAKETAGRPKPSRKAVEEAVEGSDPAVPPKPKALGKRDLLHLSCCEKPNGRLSQREFKLVQAAFAIAAGDRDAFRRYDRDLRDLLDDMLSAPVTS